ncbi:hypothetical protein C8Q77DRAFT_1159804 [Trametes polyzona]|nr:hypothetical protein C8Q77DRAFT_1159804 [Trametes polyzona]
MPTSPKRRRTGDVGLGDYRRQSNLEKCQLARLPLELVAEVLLFLPSTRDVLAVSRINRHFRTILVGNPATEFIWRNVRARCPQGRIPDPPPGMAESAFAALLFDHGVCEASNCHKKTAAHHYSYALRARLCEDKKCLSAWRSAELLEVSEVEHPDILQWIPRIERTNDDFDNKTIVRKNAWIQAVLEKTEAHRLGPDVVAAYVEAKQLLADALPAKIEAYAQLFEWRKAREVLRSTWTQIGSDAATVHAAIIGCTKWEILQSPTYTTIHYAKLRCFEEWHLSEFKSIQDAVRADIAAQKRKKSVRERDLALQRKRAEVESHYAGLASAHPKPLLPSLAEFRKLSAIKAIEASPTAQNASLSDPLVASILENNLQQWRDSARAALAAVLGFPRWKAMSRKKLHPVDRLTARFRCKRCDAAGKDTGKDGGLDFTRACEHICAPLSKKARARQQWSADNFVPDQRAIDAVTRVLELCGTNPEDVDSLAIADSVGDRVRCAVCSMTMDVRSVARHCKRHEECTFALLSEADISTRRPLEHGLAARLLGRIASTSHINDTIYACRHCDVVNGEDAGTQTQRRPKTLSFNGLRSHLKDKHGVVAVADEDFYRQQDCAPSGVNAP